MFLWENNRMRALACRSGLPLEFIVPSELVGFSPYW
jgi:hypothetical protein